MSALHARAGGGSRAWSAAEFGALLADPTCRAATEPHAFALTRSILDEAELLLIATDPAHQRTGQASRLLKHVESNLRDASVSRWSLEVSARNAPARALYEKHGFTEIARRPGYYAMDTGPAEDALILEKILTNRSNS